MESNKEILITFEKIKNDILSTRKKIFENANTELISLYFRIGKYISDNSKYGNQFIDSLSVSLKVDFPDATGFSRRNLFRMKKFYEEYKNYTIVPPAVAQLPWTHNCILIDKINEIEKRFWYAEKTLELRCYVVVELKNTDFDPAFMGQLQFYVSAIDETLKKDIDNNTIGLLLCKKKDKLSVEWSLKSVNVPVGVASYEIKNILPTEEEINRIVSAEGI